MKFGIIDFETRSRTSIKAGASRYSLDAEVMCLSYSLDGGFNVKCWRPGDPNPTDLFDAIAAGYLIFAHNATFEINVWWNVMVVKFYWPEVPLAQWRCTMAEALAMNLPAGLEHIAEGMKLAVKKDMAGRRLMLKMAKPRKPTKKDKSIWHEKPEDIKRLGEYCDDDVRAEAAVHDVVPRLCTREQQVYHYDQRVNKRGIPIDRELAESALAVWTVHTNKLNDELSRLTDGQVKTSRECQKMTEFLVSQGVRAVDLTKGTVVELLTKEIPPKAKRVLEIRQELALASVSKFAAMLRSIEADDRIRGAIQYHAAGQTGRFGGRLIQPQNFTRGSLDADELERMVELVKRRDIELIELLMPVGELLSSLLRAAIKAPPGKRFIVCDFNAVEARGLAWSAGESWLIDAFKNKQCPYCGMASKIYHKPVTKKDKTERFLGKSVVLGCGYGMGHEKFQGVLASDALKYGYDDVDTSMSFASELVKLYRKENPNIVRHWYATEKAAVSAVKLGGRHEVGPYSYVVKGDWLLCRMPAGRDIAYYKPKLVPGKYGPQISFKGTDVRGRMYTTHTYGAKLVENNTQAVCRDVLIDSMSLLEKNNYKVVMHVHDEVVVEVDEDFGSVKEVEQIMETVPKWASGFPIGAEGFECTRYRK